MSFQSVKKKVKKILENNYEARDNDKVLYYELCKVICEENGKDVNALSFKDAMIDKIITLPSSETVTRTRRKLQEHNPALWGDRRDERMRAQVDFVNFSRE